MTNEELKKKIVEILDNNIRWQPYYYISRGIVYEDDLKNIADALIAAVIGDVKSWEISDADKEQSSINYYCEMREWKDKCKEAEHRAARAERAFSKLVHEMYEHGIRPMCDEKFFVESRLKDAEKELAEERKDD